MEWGEYRFDHVDLFKLLKVQNKLSKSDLDNDGKIPVYSSESTNNGILGYTKIQPEFLVNSKNPVYLVFGDHTRSFNIATESFCVADNVKVLSLNRDISIKSLLYIISSWKKNIKEKGYSRHWSIAQEVLFQLPTKNGNIDFDFMERFIEELEKEKIQKLDEYLETNGFKDCTLTSEEEKILADFESGKVEWRGIKYEDIFNKIVQGRRLKKDDQIEGNIPFVMSGVTNTGVVNYISNPITNFPRNSITIDIFGNTFYRSYDFSAGDDTGVYWNNERTYSKETMLFFTTSIGKSLAGKFDFGNKLRSSQSFDFLAFLPTKNNTPDYELMGTLISAIQKLVIRDMVEYVGKKIEVRK